MNTLTATIIARKTRAFKHCVKLIATIDREGKATVKLNSTGVEFVVNKGDALYQRIMATRYQLMCDLNDLEVTVNPQPRIAAPYPTSASEEPTQAVMTEEEKKAHRRKMHNIYQKRWLERKKAREAAEKNN